MSCSLLSPMKLCFSYSVFAHQVSWLCLIMRYMWKEDMMSRQAVTYLTIWLLSNFHYYGWIDSILH